MVNNFYREEVKDLDSGSRENIIQLVIDEGMTK